MLWWAGCVIGGSALLPAAATQLNLVEVLGNEGQPLAVETAAWDQKVSMPVESAGLGAIFVDGNLYAIPGFAANTVRVYDAPGRTWWSLATAPEVLQNFAVASVNGRIYVFGGSALNGDRRATVQVYDPKTNSWALRSAMPGGSRAELGAATVGDKIYVVGGDTGVAYTGRLEVYDPATDRWTTSASLATPRGKFGLGVIGGKLYVAGGRDASGPRSELEVYDPTSDRWTTGPSLPSARQTSAAVLGRKLYLMGGNPGTANLVSAYDTLTGIWSDLPALKVRRQDPGLLPRFFEHLRSHEGDATPVDVEIVGVGSSIGNGAGLSLPMTPSTAAPLPWFVSELRAALGEGRNCTLSGYNYSIGGAVVIDGLTRGYPNAIAAGHSGKIVLICMGMNDGQTAQFNSGPTYPGAYNYMVSLVKAIWAQGGDPIIATTPHPHTVRDGWAQPSYLNQSYPTSIAAPVGDAAVWPSVADATQKILWKGSTIPTSRRHALVNQAFRAVARDLGVALIDVEPYWFDAVAAHGEDALFDPSEVVHPNNLGYQLSYHAAETEWIRSLLATEREGGDASGTSEGENASRRAHPEEMNYAAAADEATGTLFAVGGAAGAPFTTLEVLSPPPDAPICTAQPVSQVVQAGGGASFLVSADGTGPLSYQWCKDGVEIAGATAALLRLTDVQAAAVGSYSVCITNAAGSVTAGGAVLTLEVPAPLISSPTSDTAKQGEAYSYRIEASGFPRSFAADNLPAGLSLDPVSGEITGTPREAGTYLIALGATNESGVGAASFELTVSPAPKPTIVTLMSPTGGALCTAGSPAELRAEVTTDPANTIAKVEFLVDSAVVASLSTGPYATAWTPAGAGQVTIMVRVTDGEDRVSLSPAAIVGVLQPPAAPTIVTEPASGVAISGQTVVLSVVAAGSPSLGYQWSWNGHELTGATGSTLTLVEVQPEDAGQYQVLVSDDNGSVASQTAELVVMQVTHTILGSGCRAGGKVTVSNTIVYAGALSALGWQVLLPAGWSYVGGSGYEGDVKPADGATDLLEWGWSGVPPSPVRFNYTVIAPAGITRPTSIRAMLVGRHAGGTFQKLVLPDPLILDLAPPTHTADTNRDGKLGLPELLRVIELYNTRFETVRTGRCRVQPETEDGFAPDTCTPDRATVELTAYHDADTSRDGKLGLSEMLRLVELYNFRDGTTRSGQYHLIRADEAPTDDGFSSGP